MQGASDVGLIPIFYPDYQEADSAEVRARFEQVWGVAGLDPEKGLTVTETAEFADVVLPASSYLEKNGTYTNTDRRVPLGRKVLDADRLLAAEAQRMTDPREFLITMGYLRQNDCHRQALSLSSMVGQRWSPGLLAQLLAMRADKRTGIC